MEKYVGDGENSVWENCLIECKGGALQRQNAMFSYGSGEKVSAMIRP